MATASKPVYTEFNFDEVGKLRSTDSVCDFYDQWAKDYDEHAVDEAYRGPAIVADYVAEFYGDAKETRIMDICAGTGAGAIELAKRGFTNVDALDGSAKMLAVSKAKKLYREYVETFVNPGEETAIPSNTYDCVVCIGSFLGGHLAPQAADEFCRILKRGQLCIIGIRENWLTQVPEYNGILEPYLLGYEGWEVVRHTKVKGWFGDLSGVMYVFRKK